jgi:hypothetical protein
MRAIIASLVLCGLAVGQELPRAELDELSKKAKAAKIEALTAELQKVQSAIKLGGKGFGTSRKEGIINARKREAEIKTELDAVKKAEELVPDLDIAKLTIGQIGKLYRQQSFQDSSIVPDSRGPQRVTVTRIYQVPVEFEVVRIIDAGNVLVAYKDKMLCLRMPTAGIVTDQKLTLERAIKVLGTKMVDGRTVFDVGVYRAR